LEWKFRLLQKLLIIYDIDYEQTSNAEIFGFKKGSRIVVEWSERTPICNLLP
jgi:hypothetical protein